MKGFNFITGSFLVWSLKLVAKMKLDPQPKMEWNINSIFHVALFTKSHLQNSWVFKCRKRIQAERTGLSPTPWPMSYTFSQTAKLSCFTSSWREEKLLTLITIFIHLFLIIYNFVHLFLINYNFVNLFLINYNFLHFSRKKF